MIRNGTSYFYIRKVQSADKRSRIYVRPMRYFMLSYVCMKYRKEMKKRNIEKMKNKNFTIKIFHLEGLQ